MRKLIAVLIMIVLSALHCQSASAEHNVEQADRWYNYHWGRGVTVPAANLNIGGYFKGSYNRPEGQRETLQLDDLSLFITWTPHARLRFFSEIEQHNWINNDGVENFVDKLNVERLFVDFLITDAVSARFGKFLTPFGRWNVIHSAPLVWTTNRPVVTDNFSSPFALRANGLMLNYTHIVNEHNLDVSIYLDNSTNLEPKSFNNVIFDQAAGLRVNYEVTEELQLGFSYLSYKALKDQVDQGLPIHHLLGVDFLWQHQGYELMFESLYHTLDGAGQKLEEKGMYLQGVVPLGGKVSAVARYEYFDTKELEKSLSISHIGVLGLAWRPYLPLVMKSEYRFGNNNGIIAPSGLFVSVAMFF